ncbi:MAG TPA: hypothetical protein PLV10_09775 [Candidatus Latescibacteria bacterium]|nr:hypothetical protein [Candidatus Latescibacterota bacterium]
MLSYDELALNVGGGAGTFPSKPVPVVGAMDNLKPCRRSAGLSDDGELVEFAMRSSDYCSEGLGPFDETGEWVA